MLILEVKLLFFTCVKVFCLVLFSLFPFVLVLVLVLLTSGFVLDRIRKFILVVNF